MIKLDEPWLSEGALEHGASYISLQAENLTTRIVKMPKWQFGHVVPFFPPVRSKAHKLIVPLEGWVAYVDSIVPSGCTFRVISGRERVDIYSGTPHVLLFGPSSVVQVTSFGKLEESLLPEGGPYWRVFSRFTEADLRRTTEEKHAARHRGEYAD